MSVVAVFFCFASGKDAVADLPAYVMEGARNLKSVGCMGASVCPSAKCTRRSGADSRANKKYHCFI